MASIAMLIGEALANALAFIGSSYLFSRLSNGIAGEQKRHNLAIEQLQKAQVEWVQKHQEKINFINKQLRLERKVEANFEERNDTMREYHEVFGQQLLPQPQQTITEGLLYPKQ